MPNTDWTKLNRLQLGRYAEYFAKMEFASYGLEVYTTEVDDRGIDFVVRDNHGRFCEIQVKSLRGTGYVFMQKSKFDITNKNLYLTLLLFHSGKMPDVFLIPSAVWEIPDKIFVDKNYDKEGQKSAPEYGINISRKNYFQLEGYRFEDSIQDFLKKKE
ncbi:MULTISPECIES: DUF4365 domain-containing protein [Oceanobacillus]|uniref:DUF4365 domain-containing protein n=1 Tax=Oceanobacillus aidingensis TaxID=645964 RepID=A0ABV9K0W5_9BACI|nr:DUF4365 domain-containing protein [Oceanobacillus oncorhynchi]MDM8102374.1 DUF4365 domain-containing protein [Oceanobacillus oncorhynchi]